jgi:hypothetical protein
VVGDQTGNDIWRRMKTGVERQRQGGKDGVVGGGRGAIRWGRECTRCAFCGGEGKGKGWVAM